MNTKRVSALLVSALLIPFFSHAGEDSKITVSGHFRLRAEGDDKTDMISNRDFSVLRIRPEVKFTRDQNLEVVFTPQFTRILGDQNYVPSGAAANTQTVTSGATTDPMFSVHEAYANYHPNDFFAFKAGRMILSYGDELVIGALDWNNTGRSFDAFKTRFTYGLGWTDVFASKITENNSTSTVKGDVNFYGIYNSFNVADFMKNLDVYGLSRADSSAGPTSVTSALGVRAASKVEAIDYRAEYTKEFGNAFTETSNAQMDAEVGYTFEHSLKPRFSLEYFTAGKTYDQLYPTAHKWLGYADVLGRRNISGFVIHSEAQVLESLKAKLDFHSFNRVDSAAPVYKASGSAFGTATGSASNSVGSEFDLTMIYQASKDLKFTGGASLFNSGEYFKDQFGDIKPTFYYAQMEVSL